MLGAKVAQFAMERKLPKGHDLAIRIMNVDESELFQRFIGKEFLRKGSLRRYTLNDLQSFTLSRFWPPELMRYEGKAVVMDPDIFCRVDIRELFKMDLKGHALAACKKKDAWDTSVMLLDCSKLRHWKLSQWIEGLAEKKVDYHDIMTLQRETSVTPLSRVWNSLEYLDDSIKMLHTTDRLTQPWKTGLNIDFTRNPMPRILGVIPREWLHKMMGRYPNTYQPHPDKAIEEFVFELFSDAFKAGAISEELVLDEIEKQNLRPDFLTILKEGIGLSLNS